METEEKYDLAKWMAGEMNQDELDAFRNSPDYHYYERIADESRALRTEDFDEKAMLHTILSRQKKVDTSKVIPIHKSRWIRIAAILIIALGLFFIFKPDSIVTLQADMGKMASAVLPDGSRVDLNSDSEMAYNSSNWEQNRQLTLNGEAYFKVAKGKKFDVFTDLGKVTVVGTQFNVKARGKRFEVACYEGKVKVIVDGKETSLTAGMTSVFDNGQPQNVFTMSHPKPVWTTGEMEFISAPLDQVVAELQRRFDVKIELRAKTDKTVTGIFSATDLKETVESLCTLYNLNAKTQNNVLILSANE